MGFGESFFLGRLPVLLLLLLLVLLLVLLVLLVLLLVAACLANAESTEKLPLRSELSTWVPAQISAVKVVTG